MIEKVIKFRTLEKDYNLKTMKNYYDFRFCKDCPEGYKLYVVNEKGQSICYKLANQHRLYYKGKK